MKATRNLVAHRYDQADDEILWAARGRQPPIEAERVLTSLDA